MAQAAQAGVGGAGVVGFDVGAFAVHGDDQAFGGEAFEGFPGAVAGDVVAGHDCGFAGQPVPGGVHTAGDVGADGVDCCRVLAGTGLGHLVSPVLSVSAWSVPHRSRAVRVGLVAQCAPWSSTVLSCLAPI